VPRLVIPILPDLLPLCDGKSSWSRWPLFWDAQVFHYGNFLIDHGFVPYRDIIDMNMPGRT
jgi:hypothetical protein